MKVIGILMMIINNNSDNNDTYYKNENTNIANNISGYENANNVDDG